MKQLFLILALSMMAIPTNAENLEPIVQVFYNDSLTDCYLRSDIDSITYEAITDAPPVISVLRLHMKEYVVDYALADVDSVVFTPPYYIPVVLTRANVSNTYITSELRGEIGGKFDEWGNLQLGFFISKTSQPLTAKDRSTIEVKSITDEPCFFSYNIHNKDGYKGKTTYYYQAWAKCKNRFFLIGEVQPFSLKPVTIWTNTYANVKEEEGYNGRYYIAEVSADIFGNTEEIINEMEKHRAKVGFYYGPNQLPSRENGDMKEEGWLDEVHDIRAQLQHLDAGSNVWFRPFVEIADTIYYGIDAMLTTGAWVQVYTLDMAKVESTTASISFYVDVLSQPGQLSPVTVGVQFSTSHNLNNLSSNTYHDFAEWDASAPDFFTAEISKLKPNTTYYYRGYVVFNGIRYLGDIEKFTTKAIDLRTYEVENITSTTAFVSGKLINKDAVEEGDYFGFFINTTGNPNQENAQFVSGVFESQSDGSFWWNAEGLYPNTTYYVCSFITYMGDIYLGNTVSFTTKECDIQYGELGLFELKNKVKSCKWTNWFSSNIFTFDQNEMWLTQNGESINSIFYMGIERDVKGRIKEGYNEEGGEMWTVDDKGRKTTWSVVEYDGGEKHTYYYGENGLVVKEHVEFLGMDVYWNHEYDIIYSNWVIDSHGNWTKRSSYSSNHGSQTESRTIVYYE